MGYTNGYDNGYDDAIAENKQKWFDEGYSVGYAKGFEDGSKQKPKLHNLTINDETTEYTSFADAFNAIDSGNYTGEVVLHVHNDMAWQNDLVTSRKCGTGASGEGAYQDDQGHWHYPLYESDVTKFVIEGDVGTSKDGKVVVTVQSSVAPNKDGLVNEKFVTLARTAYNQHIEFKNIRFSGSGYKYGLWNQHMSNFDMQNHPPVAASLTFSNCDLFMGIRTMAGATSAGNWTLNFFDSRVEAPNCDVSVSVYAGLDTIVTKNSEFHGGWKGVFNLQFQSRADIGPGTVICGDTYTISENRSLFAFGETLTSSVDMAFDGVTFRDSTHTVDGVAYPGSAVFVKAPKNVPESARVAFSGCTFENTCKYILSTKTDPSVDYTWLSVSGTGNTIGGEVVNGKSNYSGTEIDWPVDGEGNPKWVVS